MAAGYMHEFTRLEFFSFFHFVGVMLVQMDFCSLYFFSAGRTLSSGNIYALIHEGPRCISAVAGLRKMVALK